MTAILQLSGAKRTYLLGKISSNLRPLKLERRRAGNLGWSERNYLPPGPCYPYRGGERARRDLNPPRPNHTADA
jgi:hypothetical protein